MQRVTLSALADFLCLGAECPDDCCSENWDIAVDAQTIRCWNELPESPFRQQLLASLAKKEKPGNISYSIARGDSPACPYFGGDRLCNIQKSFGHEMLSATCREYPRLTQQGQGFEVRSMQLSCPESARLVLFPNHTNPLFRVEEIATEIQGNPLSDFFIHLEQLLYCERHIPLSRRLLFVAKTLAELAIRSETGSLTPKAIDGWKKQLKDGLEELAIAQQTSVPTGLLGWFWQTYFLVNPKLVESLANQPTAETALWRLLTDVNVAKSDRFPAIEGLLQESHTRIMATLAPFQNAWENHLLVSLMNNGFPRNPASGNYVATLVAAVYPVAITQLLLRLQVASDTPITRESIVGLVYKVERQLSSNNRIYEFLDHNRALLRIDQYWECFGAIFPA